MNAYAADLRERVVAAVDAGVPRPEVARTFRVSVATIERYLKRRRATGSLAAGQSPGRPPEIAAAQYPALAAQVAARPDDTLAQHAATWAVGRALRRAKITRKKRR